jgi:pyrroloquinoline quinone biosynthesis protein B
MPLRVLVLGSAAGGGFPQWNCHCVNCRRARAGDPAAKPRTQSSLAVTADGEHWFLLNASPDLRQQIGATPPLHSRADPRHSPISGVVLSNGDVDHVAGLLSLRESHPLAIYGTERVQGLVGQNPIFKVLDPALVERRDLRPEETIELKTAKGEPTGLTVRPYIVPGKIALYAEDKAAGADLGTRAGDTIGLEVTNGATGAGFHYLPGCAAMPPELAARLKGAKLVFFDGTLWRDDEMINAGLGSKTGRRMGHMSVSGAEGTIAAFEPLDVGRKIFIHINNSNPMILEDSPERAQAETAGWQVAWDGMEVSL